MNDAAESAVHRAFLEILRPWDRLKAESEGLQQEVWAIVRRTVISEHLLPLREQMAALDSGSGLYAALGALPPRQLDVMVLRYIGHYDAKRSSWYTGITPQHRRLPLPQGPGAPVSGLPADPEVPGGGNRMNTWEERLAGASTCEPRRPFDVAAGLRRLAQDAGYLPATAPASAPERPDSTVARHLLTAVTSWSVAQAGAASHVKYLADIIGTSRIAFAGWTDDLDIDGVHVFACSLYLANHPESARSGGGSPRAPTTARPPTACTSSTSPMES
ncbi:hypothetical protein [Streptomyces pseudogriseolus]|uniref:hypothetical protein n=1 Tax=Streptomyces pseudogriseolus TaxID=36817 RepID=UPI003FA280ED